MTPGQVFTIVDRLTKSITILDEKARRNEENNSYLLWFDDFKDVRSNIVNTLEFIKRCEIDY